MAIVSLLTLLSFALGYEALEFNLNRPLFNSRANCEVVCVERNLNASKTGDDHALGTHRIAAISSLQVLKKDATSSDISGDKTRRILASISSQKSRLNRVSDGIKVDGRLEAGSATLRLEFVKRDDCLAEFVCQAEGVDNEGRSIVSISQILQQQRDNSVKSDADRWTAGTGIQMINLLQQMSAKLEVLGSSMIDLKDDLRRMEEANQHNVDALKSELDSKTDRVEDKIQNLGKDLYTQTDRLEDKIEDVDKGQGKKLNQLVDKAEDLLTRVEDKLVSLIEKKFNTESCSDISVNDVERIVEREIMALDAKLSTLEDDLSLRGRNIADNINASLSKFNQKLDSWETKKNQHRLDMAQKSTTPTSQKGDDLATLIDSKFDSLQDDLEVKFHEMSASVNLSAVETRVLLNEKSSMRNATLEEDLKSTLTNFLTPKDCYKGMSSLAPSTSSPYAVIQPNRVNNFAAPVLCDTFTNGGGWVVFQRRLSGNLTFYRNWQEYKTGFGSLGGDFWLGNDNINALTKDGIFELRIGMMYKGKFAYAQYDSFSVGDESSLYVLHVSGYSGNAGDSMTQQNGIKFSTHDRDNDNWSKNCAVEYVGAWWYNSCHYSNLNGQWGSGGEKGPRWHTFSSNDAVTYSEMKFRRLI